MRSVPTTPTPAVSEVDLLAVTDLWERARLAGELAKQLQAGVAAALGVRREAVRALVLGGEPQRHVARHLGMSPTRVNQIIGAVQDPRTTGAVA